jgi:hypothetical protein
MSASKRFGFLLTSLLVGLLAMPVLGQDQNGGGQNNGGQNGGGGGGGQNGGGGGGQNGGGGGGGGFRGRGFNPQAQLDFFKQQLGASDDEFAAIQPKIQAVMQLQRDANAGRGRGFFGGRGGPGGGGPRGGGGFGGPPSTQPSPVQDALTDLRTTLDDQSASPDVIKAKLEAVRQARVKSKQDLAVAQQDLKSVLTQRQEAVMVLFGMLD